MTVISNQEETTADTETAAVKNNDEAMDLCSRKSQTVLSAKMRLKRQRLDEEGREWPFVADGLHQLAEAAEIKQVGKKLVFPFPFFESSPLEMMDKKSFLGSGLLIVCLFQTFFVSSFSPSSAFFPLDHPVRFSPFKERQYFLPHMFTFFWT